ncbi:zinc-binding alcohol dehydrogenase [Spongiactinospora gelatinilytica]|uniref:Zinc-binding alcohol dehydrogenase n=1 Tax=Spongiactinospora gelatinilytica TaxID=2666298 RepID=A0A2W2HJX7_9ACTN|nr:zinc-binding dehydrogenase [Spongiactinospora gelatinilytica]PZG51985.1 zinc-binding alcohol dehydrogenase [Spongiactinospora gelatinilytica]
MGEGRVLRIPAAGRAEIVTEAVPDVADGRFRVETLYSGISAGTELTYLKGTNPYLRTSWDGGLGLFTDGEPAIEYPVTGIGYMQVGRVTESRTAAVSEGAVVAMTYGHRTVHVADPMTERFVELPGEIDPMLGIWVAHMGPICANGLLHAAHDVYGPAAGQLGDGVRGRRVAVTGAGVVGLLVTAFALEHGAAEVIVIDGTPSRRRAAEALGARALDPEAVDAPLTVKQRWRRGPGDRGADVVFQCRGRPGALALALRLLRPQGTVIDLAFYTDGAEQVRLGEEFHHNGLGVRCAQIGRVPRGMAHLWDRERLSAETIGLLRARGSALREHLITEVAAFDDAPALLVELAERRRHAVQAVLSA